MNHKIYVKNWLRFLIISLIILGVFFRVTNLDLKVFWVDEVINIHYTFGYTEFDIGEQVKQWNGQVISISDLQKYQSPSIDRGYLDTIKALATEEPQSTPLYYLLLKAWIQLFGDSIAVRRSLSVLFSLLAFPCVYWLSWELFSSSLVSWLSVALFAISPFHLVYAQEARYYAAWTTIIVLSSALLLWAIRRKRKLPWIAYGATLTTGLYIYPFTALIAISHGVYLAIINKFRINKTTLSYLLASFSSLVAFSPWGFLILTGSGQMSKWRQTKVPLFSLYKTWISCLSITFWDFNKTPLLFTSSDGAFLNLLLELLLLVLFAYVFYFLIRNTDPENWLFILILVFLPWLFLALPDVLKGGIRSTIPRYLVASYLGIQIATAYFFAVKKGKIWQFVFSILVAISITSCIVYSQSEIWWNKNNNIDNPAIAQILNQSDNSLLVGHLTNDSGRSIISLSYYLKPSIRLQLIHSDSVAPEIPRNFDRIFLYALPDKLKESIQSQSKAKIEVVYQGKKRVLEKL